MQLLRPFSPIVYESNTIFFTFWNLCLLNFNKTTIHPDHHSRINHNFLSKQTNRRSRVNIHVLKSNEVSKSPFSIVQAKIVILIWKKSGYVFSDIIGFICTDELKSINNIIISCEFFIGFVGIWKNQMTNELFTLLLKSCIN